MVQFIKVHASGNDFILIKDNFNNVYFKKSQIRNLCNRKYGIGADGIIVIRPAINKVLVKFYNNDGTEPEMCINGVRCIGYILKEMFPTRNIFRLVLPRREVEVLVRKYDYKQQKAYVEINLGKPKFDYYGKKFSSDKAIKIRTSLGEIEGYYVSFDNPHFVVFNDLKIWGADHPIKIHSFKLRIKDRGFYDRLGRMGKEFQVIFKKGINVEFVQARGSKEVTVLFWERGVGWTDSCGSGSCAVGVILKKHIFKNSREFYIRSVGGIVKIKVDKDFNTYLEGESQKVFEGYF